MKKGKQKLRIFTDFLMHFSIDPSKKNSTFHSFLSPGGQDRVTYRTAELFKIQSLTKDSPAGQMLVATEA